MLVFCGQHFFQCAATVGALDVEIVIFVNVSGVLGQQTIGAGNCTLQAIGGDFERCLRAIVNVVDGSLVCSLNASAIESVILE